MLQLNLNVTVAVHFKSIFSVQLLWYKVTAHEMFLLKKRKKKKKNDYVVVKMNGMQKHGAIPMCMKQSEKKILHRVQMGQFN